MGHGWNTDFKEIVEALVPRACFFGRRLAQPPLQLPQFPIEIASIFPPHVARQNIQLGAVLGHGAPRDRDPALAQNLDDLVIA